MNKDAEERRQAVISPGGSSSDEGGSPVDSPRISADSQEDVTEGMKSFSLERGSSSSS